jgi:GTP-binding protein
MRREGFELSIGRPKVLFHKDPKTGEVLEPIEELYVDVDDEFSGIVIDKLIQKKGEMVDMRSSGVGKTRIKFLIPTRGLIGYHSDFLTDTRGSGIMNRTFHSYAPFKGTIDERTRGALVSMENGRAVAYALFFLKDRGTLFISPGTQVYDGMIIGEHSRENELEVNPTKEKQLSNCRAAGKDENIKLPNPRILSL